MIYLQLYLQWIFKIVVIVSSTVCMARQPQSSDNYQTGSLIQHQKQIMVRRLSDSLSPVHKVARLYYGRNHECTDNDAILFPVVHIGDSGGKFGLPGVKEIFESNTDTLFSLDNDVIKVRIGHIPWHVLNAKIRGITLTSWEQYNPSLAINSILNAPKVKSVMAANSVTAPILLNATFVTPPTPGFPHLPRLLKHVTVDKAFDLIARVFNGVVIYNVCRKQQKKVIYVTFSPLKNR